MSDSAWRRGSVRTAVPSTRGRGRGGWSTGAPARSDATISSSGFRKALYQQPLSEMEMLQSPSRGIEDESKSLRNPEVQVRFREHIAEKLSKLDTLYPIRGAASTKRLEELSVILLDFRKLREGLTSIRRVDSFAAEVYESSVRYSIEAESWAQLGTCLPTLVLELHPLLLPSPDLSSTLTNLTLHLSPTLPLPPPPTKETVELYQSLYLLHLICHLTDLRAFKPSYTSFLPSPPSPTPSHLLFTLKVYELILRNSFISLYPFLYPSTSPSPTLKVHPMQTAVIRGSITRLREQAWRSLEKVYKVPDFKDREWISRVLLFGPDEDGLDEYLTEKGR